MADSFTSNLNLTKPEVGASSSTWGTKLNTDLDVVDSLFSGVSTVAYSMKIGSANTLAVDGLLSVSGTASVSGTVTGTGTFNLLSAVVGVGDANFSLKDTGDSTRIVKFELGGLTTSTTRTITVPDADITLVGAANTQTLTNKTLTNAIVGTQTASDNSTKAASTAYVDTAVTTTFAPSPPQGRLTLTTSLPVLTSAVTGATSIFYTPYCGDKVPIYNGSIFVMTTFTELTNTTTDSTKNPAAVTTNSNYDLFVWSDSGTVRLGRGPVWTSDTARGTGAGTTELERVNGILVNKIAITNGPAAQRGTYVGTVRSDGSSQINWQPGAVAASGTAALLCVWNAHNRVRATTLIGDTTDNWTYSTATIRPANNSTTMRVSFVQGLQEDSFSGDYRVSIADAGGGTGIAGIGYNSTSTFSGRRVSATNPPGNSADLGGTHTVQALGFNYMQACEYGVAGTILWVGDAGGSLQQSGLIYDGRF